MIAAWLFFACFAVFVIGVANKGSGPRHNMVIGTAIIGMAFVGFWLALGALFGGPA